MPPLGFIRKKDRSPAQLAESAHAESRMVQHHALTPPTVSPGTKLMLTDAWKHPDVVKELGDPFPRFRQLTGSCVGAGGGNAVMTLVCLQAALGQSTPVLVWWPFAYGRCRYNEGDRGPGEGAMGSSLADTVVKEGVLDAKEQGLPPFDTSDGLALTSRVEMQWSDGGSSTVTKWLPTAAKYPLGAATPCRNAQDIKALVLNGYPGTFACDNYIGSAHVQGSGGDAAVVGYWDGSGGHQQYFVGYWENPSLGPLYGIGNNWAGDTYPRDPGGLPACCCWVTEAKVDQALHTLDAEVYGFSHQTWFAPQPQVLVDFSTL
jgi:hypothetical protein